MRLSKDNWSQAFGNRYVTMLSKNELGLLDPMKKIYGKKIKNKFIKNYQKFQSQPVEWNEGITKYLDLLLNAELKKLESVKHYQKLRMNDLIKLNLSFIEKQQKLKKDPPRYKIIR